MPKWQRARVYRDDRCQSQPSGRVEGQVTELLPAVATDPGAPSERKRGGSDGLRSAGRRWFVDKVVGAILTEDCIFHGTNRNDG